jgi:hypothetical protein
MEPRVVIVEDWPPPDTVESALLILDASKVMVGYGTGDGEFAVVTFRGGCDIKEGGPNDETLSGHPLYRYGLKHYSIHRIENSPWLQDLERQNSVHPAHSPERFLSGKVHFVFALKEQTVECLVRESAGVQVEVFESRRAAVARSCGRIDA